MAFGDINSGTTIELTQEQLNAIIKQTLLAAHPVGSIYQSLDSTPPADLFGGTWEKLENRFLLAAYDGCTAGNIGGEATHTLTVNEMPRHNHKDMYWGDGSSNQFGVNNSGTGIWRFSYEGAASEANFYTNYVGGSAAHNNMPPYLAVWTWKRTA